MFFDDNVEIKNFMNSCNKLKYLDLSESLSLMLSDKIFYFNKLLEVGLFSGNFLNSFPKFCQYCSSDICNKIPNMNFECKLKQVAFDSNNLEKVLYLDLVELSGLEYLNLENNSISFIEANSFSNLIRLETLSALYFRLKKLFLMIIQMLTLMV